MPFHIAMAHGYRGACKVSLRSVLILFRILHVETMFGIESEGFLHACISSKCRKVVIANHFVGSNSESSLIKRRNEIRNRFEQRLFCFAFPVSGCSLRAWSLEG